jgi:hypothetical protein
MEKPPCVELGKPMNWCARVLRAEHIDGRLELPSEWWNGWRIVKNRLIGPGGMTFDSKTLIMLWRSSRLREHQRRVALRTARTPHGRTLDGSR